MIDKRTFLTMNMSNMNKRAADEPPGFAPPPIRPMNVASGSGLGRGTSGGSGQVPGFGFASGFGSGLTKMWRATGNGNSSN